MKAHRIAFLVGALGCAVVGAVAPATGCNGTGTTPMCDFPDGANNPESGCGELSEAAVGVVPNDVSSPEPDVVEPVDSPVEKPDASDAGGSESQDAADAHGGVDAHEDASDAHELDGHADAKG